MTRCLARSPIPNQAVTSGTSAMAGIGRRNDITGFTSAATRGW
ncbi:hypothetical protein ACFWOX_36335 [Streptomyces sp. NPDC058467]